MYSVCFFNKDRDDWKLALQDAIAQAVYRHTGSSSLIAFVSTDDEGADLVICLGSTAMAADSTAHATAAALLQRKVRILPVVSDLKKFSSEIPEPLRVINGMGWGDPHAIAEAVLRHLGLTEKDRRVFISYLRKETTPLAHQLYDELHRRGFFVFLDSFEVEHGSKVQDRIEEALHETSFVLLLYSPAVESSGWVEKEINFALVHRLGLMALALPGAGKKSPFAMTPNDRREELNKSDLDPTGALTEVALERICLALEREHADQFRSRRDRLLQDLSEALGNKVVRVGTHSFRYDGVNVSALVRVNPRAPQTRDLYLLDQDYLVAIPINTTVKRVLVAARGGYREHRDLTQWACAALEHKVYWLEPEAVCADPSILEK